MISVSMCTKVHKSSGGLLWSPDALPTAESRSVTKPHRWTPFLGVSTSSFPDYGVSKNPCLGQLTSTGKVISYSALLSLTSLAINSHVSLGALRGVERSIGSTLVM